MEEITSGSSTLKKRRIDQVDGADENAGPPADGEKSFDDLLDGDDWGDFDGLDQDEGDDGMLQEQRDRAAELILSPSKLDAEAARQSSSSTPARKLSHAGGRGDKEDAMLVDEPQGQQEDTHDYDDAVEQREIG